ncbi:MAG: hypothetical protein HUU21_16930 [Polyangiaceae bacterium]|nr:hypothetical protein [Polyangiaceae bacterium]
MLEHLVLPRRGAFRAHSLAVLAAGGLLALASTGCTSIVGEQSAETKFLVGSAGDGSFFGWSEITIEQDANSVDGAKLNAVTIEPLEGSSATDLTFVQSVVGEAVTSKARTTVVEQLSMPPGERLVSMNVVHTGDLRGFFEDGHTIRVEWSGKTNPSYPWPPEGIWIRVRVFVEIE